MVNASKLPATNSATLVRGSRPTPLHRTLVFLFPFSLPATAPGEAKQAPALCRSAHPLVIPAQVFSPTTEAKAAAAQSQRWKWKLLRSRFEIEIPCYITRISILYLLPHHPIWCRFYSGRLRSNSGSAQVYSLRRDGVQKKLSTFNEVPKLSF